MRRSTKEIISNGTGGLGAVGGLRIIIGLLVGTVEWSGGAALTTALCAIGGSIIGGIIVLAVGTTVSFLGLRRLCRWFLNRRFSE
jgi:hypothetical protein